MKLITIKSSKFASDLAVLKSRLEAEGIYCTIKNELSSQVVNQIPIFAELQVMENDLPAVKTIMVECGELVTEPILFQCPHCKSKDIKEIKDWSLEKFWKNIIIVFTALVSMVPVKRFSQSGKYVCNKCGYSFSIKSN